MHPSSKNKTRQNLLYPSSCSPYFLFSNFSLSQTKTYFSNSLVVMAQFSRFPLLPPELRDQVWDEALLQENEQRLIVLIMHLGHQSVGPLPCLVSPLLAVNTESRARAKTFYPRRITVHQTSPRIFPLFYHPTTFPPLEGEEADVV